MAEMYIEEKLYQLTKEFLVENNVTGDINHIVSQRIGRNVTHSNNCTYSFLVKDDMFEAMNIHLMNLDNGGYKLISDGSFTLLKLVYILPYNFN